MTFDYYPGCTLKTKAKDLDIHARNAALALGIELEELPEWQCCGAVYPIARDEIATRLTSVRALASARDRGRELLTLCSACHHVIKRVNNDIQTDDEIRNKVNNYLAPDIEYNGETKVVHYLEMLRDTVGFDTIREKAVKPMTGKRIGAYYGCLLLRPNNVMAFDNPENPTIMEDFIRALGAEPVLYPYRNECCGGYVAMDDKTLAAQKCKNITSSALERDVDMLITACPLCMYNLDINTNTAEETKLPIYYFTQLLAQVLDI